MTHFVGLLAKEKYSLERTAMQTNKEIIEIIFIYFQVRMTDEGHDLSIPYLTSSAEVVSVAEQEPGFGLARECIDQDCGYWSLPPPGSSSTCLA